jgi:hypothetical protein
MVGDTRPLILMGHGGGQHKKAPDIAEAACENSATTRWPPSTWRP